MKLNRSIFVTVLICLVATAPAAFAAEDGGDQASPTKTIDLPSLSTIPSNQYPYTVEIPVSWEIRREIPAPGVFVGPPGAQPEFDYDMIFVRPSQVDLTSPEAVVEAIRANDESQPWSAAELEVIEVGDRRGVWVLLDVPAMAGKAARKTLTVKLPIEGGSLDVLTSAPSDRFDELRGTFESVLRSIRPKAEAEGEGESGGGVDG